MERLALVEFTETANHTASCAASRRGLRAAVSVNRRRPAFLFVTFASELEGDPTFFFCVEAFDG